ncbi:hypothetical protein Tco_0925336 [Tanacetum coccineum]|uniref:Uncharacterized protein n=1 Tax=Tanacetum coccineum TaxID=301880 RepID=A0ABQ5D7F2_9ASTR
MVLVVTAYFELTGYRHPSMIIRLAKSGRMAESENRSPQQPSQTMISDQDRMSSFDAVDIRTCNVLFDLLIIVFGLSRSFKTAEYEKGDEKALYSAAVLANGNLVKRLLVNASGSCERIRAHGVEIQSTRVLDYSVIMGYESGIAV